MYPTMYALYNMDRLLKAIKITPKDTTAAIQHLLSQITRDDIRNPGMWSSLVTICRIRPDMDILPARSDYAGDNTLNIGLNYIVSDGPSLWYALSDIIADKFLTGKTPIIEEAITFVPVGVQDDLQDIEVLKGIPCGKDEDFVRKLIEERIRIKEPMEKATKTEKEEMKLREHILKIIANALYGTLVETNTNSEKDTPVRVYGLETFETTVDKVEKEGRMFNPIISIFLTAGARLILAMAETLVNDAGGYMAYCDTDSILVSLEHTKLVQDFFRQLNPYNVSIPDMFKVEDDDFDQPMRDVWFYGTSAKRYVIYTISPTGDITVVKHSAHGLGGLVNIDEKQVWKDILEVHYGKRSMKDMLRRYRDQYAVGKLNISSWDVLKRFKDLNKDKKYQDQIKPANFITVGIGYLDDPATGKKVIPMLPYVDPKSDAFQDIPYMPFRDYKTGKLYKDEELEEGQLWTHSYWEPLSQVVRHYMDHPESKSEGDTGLLKRRTVRITDDKSIRYIGKETNELEVTEVVGVTGDEYTEYIDWRRIMTNLIPQQAAMAGISPRNRSYLKRKARDNEPIRLKPKTWRALLKTLDYKEGDTHAGSD